MESGPTLISFVRSQLALEVFAVGTFSFIRLAGGKVKITTDVRAQRRHIAVLAHDELAQWRAGRRSVCIWAYKVHNSLVGALS